MNIPPPDAIPPNNTPNYQTSTLSYPHLLSNYAHSSNDPPTQSTPNLFSFGLHSYPPHPETLFNSNPIPQSEFNSLPPIEWSHQFVDSPVLLHESPLFLTQNSCFEELNPLSSLSDYTFSSYNPYLYYPPACRFFASGGCARGIDCTFTHIGVQTRGMLNAERRQHREDIRGRVCALAKDQFGCRLLQQMVEESRMYDVIFDEAMMNVNELMTDPFGNYLLQKLIALSSRQMEAEQQGRTNEKIYSDGKHFNQKPSRHRIEMIQRISGNLVSICLNLHGTRSIQKLISEIRSQEEIDLIVKPLSSSVITLIKDLNSNHVIQRLLQYFPPAANQFIFDAVAHNIVSVATHKHGCCVLQRCIDYASQTQKQQLVDKIIDHSLELVQDAYGNYSVQYICSDIGNLEQLINIILPHIGALSMQKFSSNVIEKCLEAGTDVVRQKICDELIKGEHLPQLLSDPFGNYVIQTCLSLCLKQQFDKLVEVIKPHLNELRHTAFGKRIQSRILRKFPEMEIEGEREGEVMKIVPHSFTSTKNILRDRFSQNARNHGTCSVSTLNGRNRSISQHQQGFINDKLNFTAPFSKHQRHLTNKSIGQTNGKPSRSSKENVDINNNCEKLS